MGGGKVNAVFSEAFCKSRAQGTLFLPRSFMPPQQIRLLGVWWAIGGANKCTFVLRTWPDGSFSPNLFVLFQTLSLLHCHLIILSHQSGTLKRPPWILLPSLSSVTKSQGFSHPNISQMYSFFSIFAITIGHLLHGLLFQYLYLIFMLFATTQGRYFCLEPLYTNTHITMPQKHHIVYNLLLLTPVALLKLPL